MKIQLDLTEDQANTLLQEQVDSLRSLVLENRAKTNKEYRKVLIRRAAQNRMPA